MNGKPEVMVVDDDLSICDFLKMFLGSLGYRPVTVANADEAIRHYHVDRPAAVILDIAMPGSMDGLGALASFKKIDHEVPVIVLSGQGRTTTVVQAMKLGAFDFVSKPFDESDLETLLAKAIKQWQLNRDAALLRERFRSQNGHTMLVGTSERMSEVQDLINRVASTDVTVLVRGESGTGKELVARALFNNSARHDKPFVKVNCAALPAELLESELFGFERGAFTGAIQQKPGKFEFANHGTMFLDEIGEMSVPLQAKLLQVLQDGEFARLGGKHDVRVDVRVIAATNRDLQQAVADNQFREDLFFRLNVVSIEIPPLRERREEIPLLTDHFLRKYSVQFNKPYADISPDTKRLFMDYEWPGNVRELENLIKRLVVLGTETPIRKEIGQRTALAAHQLAAPPPAPIKAIAAAPTPAADLPPSPAPSPSTAGQSLKDISRAAAREAERELIAKTLQEMHWNRKETAQVLGISYKALLYKIKENGLNKAR